MADKRGERQADRPPPKYDLGKRTTKLIEPVLRRGFRPQPARPAAQPRPHAVGQPLPPRASSSSSMAGSAPRAAAPTQGAAASSAQRGARGAAPSHPGPGQGRPPQRDNSRGPPPRGSTPLPAAAHNGSARNASNSQARLEEEVLCGVLWHSPCQAASAEVSLSHGGVPLSFATTQQYLETFEPLLHEEAREAVKSEWADVVDAHKPHRVKVESVDEEPSGWVMVRVAVATDYVQNGAIAVLSTRPPGGGQRGSKQALEWVARALREQDDEWAAQHAQQQGVCGVGDLGEGPPQRQGGDGDGRPRKARKVGPGRGAEGSAQRGGQGGGRGGGQGGGGGGGRGRGRGRRGGGDDGDGDDGEALGIVAAIIRQRVGDGTLLLAAYPRCAAHADVDNAPCGQVIEQLRRTRQWYLSWVSPLTTVMREHEALHKVRGFPLRDTLLHPERLAEAGRALMSGDEAQRWWPLELAAPLAGPFIKYLRQRYDDTQLRAIEVGCHHLGASNVPGKEPLPFVLIQGPPGTGKTHTVKGILNVWHLVHYQRYYDDLAGRVMAAAKRAARRGAASPDGFGGGGGGLLDDLMAQVAQPMGDDRSGPSPNALLKPRILVATPSNAAVDELLTRIIEEGFVDKRGGRTNPNVLRVGSESATMPPAVQAVFVDARIQELLQLSPEAWHMRMLDSQEEVRRLSHHVQALQGRSLGGLGAEGLTEGELETLQREVTPLHDRLAAAQARAYRLQVVQHLVLRRPGPQMREVRDQLEASFIRDAQFVFTTLSSTGRKIFGRLQGEFQAVLVDEAAQATELATLQPLMFGCKQVVLVGDPQQLPATVLSMRAAELQMDRSLFERLQAGGCPSQMLAVQYRMHPAIRHFPSKYFYEDRLQDAPCITNAPPAVFYEHGLLRPYVLFDVAHGRERRAGSGSVRNEAEAELAASLFYELRTLLVDKAQRGERPPRVVVGVITPYREQRDCLRAAFRRLLGPDVAAEVKIETVDSFQGQQMDVIIMSAVRAGGRGSSVGFVADVRRMNVAITRAKAALWLLGNVSTLEVSPQWSALIQDARERQLVIADARAEDLFPHHPYWRQQEEQQQQKAAAEAAAAMQQQQLAPTEAAAAMQRQQQGIRPGPGLGPGITAGAALGATQTPGGNTYSGSVASQQPITAGAVGTAQQQQQQQQDLGGNKGPQQGSQQGPQQQQGREGSKGRGPQRGPQPGAYLEDVEDEVGGRRPRKEAAHAKSTHDPRLQALYQRR